MKKTTLNKDGKLYSLLSTNAYHVRAPYVKATGFRMSSLYYSERENLYNIAEDFLVNSFLKRNNPEIENSITSYLHDDGMKLVSLIGKEDLSAFQTIELKDGAPLDIALGEAIVRRRSIRDFTGDPVDLKNLTSMLRAAIGVSAKADISLSDDSNVQFNLRTTPSAGGLYPIDLYFAALNVNGLAQGIYRYQSVEDKLVLMGDKNQMHELLKSFSGSVDMVKASQASLLFLFIAKPWRSMRKYGHRGMRFVFHEIGGITQNLHLAVAALGLGSVDCASFYEDDAHQALGFDGVCQVVLHSALVGIIA